MAVTLPKSPEEIQQMPLVELAWWILKEKKEPYYFRDLMKEIQALRNMTDEEVMDVIARLYTEINIDGRFVCIGQNVWGLKRWYPVDKVNERTQPGKRFIRGTGDAFSDDDEDLDLDEYAEEEELAEEEAEETLLFGEEEEEPALADEEEADPLLAADDEVFVDDAELPDEELLPEEEAAVEDEEDES
ncbi:hypothetical protein GCM10010885_09750 [Alicyclobacillus cellulosilyticus]|uniref:Probable DNA-directed RNA polymerase subunit delta n=1 Tax=Alicyclobacillus cellulosilyticus TaxID=1003997 RepID=A0A917K686_9BACL|nr:DNA-directed RNA polymerase subunit delta [Alicyclobacillus cellulosilyticus]GGJ02515.1 hypothetical protein GCM10010885_09750 [Alicyclobacillus cellulosilyticus]